KEDEDKDESEKEKEKKEAEEEINRWSRSVSSIVDRTMACLYVEALPVSAPEEAASPLATNFYLREWPKEEEEEEEEENEEEEEEANRLCQKRDDPTDQYPSDLTLLDSFESHQRFVGINNFSLIFQEIPLPVNFDLKNRK
ncbi:hypothetical protein V1478_008542, partial [Vespula squamosa]